MNNLSRFAITLVALLLCYAPLAAADESLDSLDSSDDCLQKMSWLEGDWTGDGFGGVCYESWGPVNGGTRTGTFKLVVEDRVVFYEFMMSGMVDGVLTKRLRHFNPDMSGWEDDKEQKWVEFPFVGCTEDKILFEGLSFERLHADTVRVTVDLGHSESEPNSVELIYHRVR